MKVISYVCDRCGTTTDKPYEIKPHNDWDEDLFNDVHVCVKCVSEILKPENEQSVREDKKAELKAKVEDINKVKKKESKETRTKPKAAKTLLKPKAIVRNNTDWSFLPEDKQRLFAAIDKGKYFAFMRTHRTKEFIRVEFGIDIEDVDILRKQWGEELKEYLNDPDAWAKKTYGYKKPDEE